MKLLQTHFARRRRAGIMLVECMVYISVFTILGAIATATFYFCWDHTRAVTGITDDITAALHTGERWRADVRGATGKISVETTAAGQMVSIPQAGREIIYRFEAGELRREVSAPKISQLLLPKVKASEMKTETRGGVTAWCWEVELPPRLHETRLPLRFTFQAAQTKS